MPMLPAKSGRLRRAASAIADLARTVGEISRDNAGRIAFGSSIVAGSAGLATLASAQPVGEPVVDAAVQAVSSGSPWAIVTMGVIFLAQQLGSGLSTWAKTRGARVEQAEADAKAAREAELAARLEVAELRAEVRLLSSRLADASGTWPRPPEG